MEERQDLISRRAAIDALRVAYWDDNIKSVKDDPCIVDAMTDWAIRQVKALPSARPEINTDGDTISRRVAIDAIMSLVNFDTVKELRQYCDSHLAVVWSDGIRDAIDAIYDVDSTQPERKTGRWIYEERKRLIDETDDGPVYRTEKWWSCSECGYAKGYQISNPSSNYCENCGAKMLKDGEG